MKKTSLIMLTWILLICLTACGLPGMSANEEEADEIAVNFDLSDYEAHGTLSCGLIWVETTSAGSYNREAESRFAYLDVQGNVKSDWFSSGMYDKADFVNGFLILAKKNDAPFRVDSRECIIYDTEFRIVANGWFDCVDGLENLSTVPGILEANANGEIFAYGAVENHGSGLVMITQDKVVEFDVSNKVFDNASIKNLKRIRQEKGFYIVDCRMDLVAIGNLPCYMGVFDGDGNCLFAPSEQLDYEVYNVTVISENEFRIKFKGQDGGYYLVNTDRSGTFLTNPVRE